MKKVLLRAMEKALVRKYYRHLKRQSRSETRKIVEDHIKVTIKRTLNELKKRVDRKTKEEGISKESLKPPYWSVPFWKDLLKYWETNEGHLHRSSVRSANRQQVERLHSVGARSYNKVREERYAAILECMPVEVTQTGDRDEPCDWWMEALGVPKEIRDNPSQFARQLSDEDITTFAIKGNGKGTSKGNGKGTSKGKGNGRGKKNDGYLSLRDEPTDFVNFYPYPNPEIFER
ncbi:hypothetical protein AgCh_036736 [Apium graveolens]